MDDGIAGPGESASEEVRHRFVEIDEHGHADQPERDGREDEPIGKGCHLHQRIPTPGLGSDERPGDPDEERHVFGEVGPKARALVPLDVEAAHADAGNLAVGVVTGTTERDDLNRPTRFEDRLGLAPYAGIFLVVGMGDQDDGTDHSHHARPVTPS